MSLDRQRLDKWLWHARVVRTRTAAAALVNAGHVRVNAVRADAPSRVVKVGDVLTISLDARVRVLTLVGFADRRGSAEAAKTLYGEADRDRRAPPQASHRAAEDDPATCGPAPAPPGRPSKRARRALLKIRRGEET